jgi:hypothetical protein
MPDRIQALQETMHSKQLAGLYGGERELSKQQEADSRYGAAVLLHVVLCFAAHHTRWLFMICFSLEIIFARTMWFKQ